MKTKYNADHPSRPIAVLAVSIILCAGCASSPATSANAAPAVVAGTDSAKPAAQKSEPSNGNGGEATAAAMVAASAAGATAPDPEEELTEAVVDLIDKTMAGKNPPLKLAVYSFECEQDPGSILGPYIASILPALVCERYPAGKLHLVERKEFDKVKAELGIAASALVEDGDRPEIGRLLGVSHMLTGTVYVLGGGKLRMAFRLIDIETGGVSPGLLKLQAPELADMAKQKADFKAPPPANTQPASAPAMPSKDPEVEKLVQTADLDFDMGRYDDAEKKYEQAFAKEKSSRIALQLGLLKQARGRMDEAEGLYAQATELDEKNAAAWVNLGCARLEKGDADKARECLKKALEIDPNNRDAREDMGVLHYSCAEDAEAEDAFRGLLRDYPQVLRYRRRLAKVLTSKAMQLERGSNEIKTVLAEADELLRPLVQKTPSDPFFHEVRGVVHHLRGDYAGAIRELQLAIGLFAQYGEAFVPMESYYNLACAQALSGDKAGAIKSLKKAVAKGGLPDGWKEDKDLSGLKGMAEFEGL
ncbi:MAG TPA: tetratricopeptide repeat protein [Candidatus Brocadiia bacterium]|nr:tetratricopeptide repeat protein [Candidatus Brocadiia bacterium]